MKITLWCSDSTGNEKNCIYIPIMETSATIITLMREMKRAMPRFTSRSISAQIFPLKNRMKRS